VLKIRDDLPDKKHSVHSDHLDATELLAYFYPSGDEISMSFSVKRLLWVLFMIFLVSLTFIREMLSKFDFPELFRVGLLYFYQP
jgi:hypothetical protein